MGKLSLLHTSSLKNFGANGHQLELGMVEDTCKPSIGQPELFSDTQYQKTLEAGSVGTKLDPWSRVKNIYYSELSCDLMGTVATCTHTSMRACARTRARTHMHTHIHKWHLRVLKNQRDGKGACCQA